MAISDEISVGVIGCGRSAVFQHLPAIKQLAGLFRISAVCDIEKSRREHVESIFPDVRHYRRSIDMVDDLELDLVLVCTPTLDHDKIVLECLSRKLWTVCETPVTATHEGAVVLRGASLKAGRKLIAATPQMFSPEFRLAAIARARKKIGSIYDIRIRSGVYSRRDDWQATTKRGGGAVFFAAQEPMLQALSLLKTPPVQMWSECKKLVALGDAEDYVHLIMRNADGITADVEANSAVVGMDDPAIELRGTRGSFFVQSGATAGIYRIIDPSQRFTHKRSSIALPPLVASSEKIRIVEESLELPDAMPAHEAFWRAVYATVRNGRPFPVDFDEIVELARYTGIVRKSPTITV
ncbi:MAG: Gfo/Idh/MocA family oxidoreductase [Kiritimatiellae bacterium]|nr:Gfo/Idh/MocA family oxidoreductase [Kiritimatiellia bacterium]